MTLEYDRNKNPERILRGLAECGPSSRAALYALCGARDGGQQHFVRQALRMLEMDCKIRRQDRETYAIAERPSPPPVELRVDPAIPPEAREIVVDAFGRIFGGTDPEPSSGPAPSGTEPEEAPGERMLSAQASPPKTFRAWMLERLSDAEKTEQPVGALIAEAIAAGMTVNRQAGYQAMSKMVREGELERPRRGYVRTRS